MLLNIIVPIFCTLFCMAEVASSAASGSHDGGRVVPMPQTREEIYETNLIQLIRTLFRNSRIRRIDEEDEYRITQQNGLNVSVRNVLVRDLNDYFQEVRFNITSRNQSRYVVNVGLTIRDFISWLNQEFYFRQSRSEKQYFPTAISVSFNSRPFTLEFTVSGDNLELKNEAVPASSGPSVPAAPRLGPVPWDFVVPFLSLPDSALSEDEDDSMSSTRTSNPESV